MGLFLTNEGGLISKYQCNSSQYLSGLEGEALENGYPDPPFDFTTLCSLVMVEMKSLNIQLTSVDNLWEKLSCVVGY